ncbi:MAG: hypothetical protein AB4042_13425 [Leptolyngbyaceae cyanobacterium]
MAPDPSNPDSSNDETRPDFTDSPDEVDRDTEVMGWNHLSRLGNYAIQQGLIIGHGFYKGQYEILKPGEALVMSPDEALGYLQQLIREAENNA